MHKRWFEMHVPRLVKKGFFSGWVEIKQINDCETSAVSNFR